MPFDQVASHQKTRDHVINAFYTVNTADILPGFKEPSLHILLEKFRRYLKDNNIEIEPTIEVFD